MNQENSGGQILMSSHTNRWQQKHEKITVKPVLSNHSKIDETKVSKTNRLEIVV